MRISYILFKIIEKISLFFEEVISFINMIIKYRNRKICESKNDHNWKFHGYGWLIEVKYPFVCKRCGCRSNGNLEDLNKKGFKGVIKIN